MRSEWFTVDPDVLTAVVVSAAAVLGITVALIRVVGLRSLSKMSGADFVTTVAIGSLIATTAATPTTLWTGGLAIAVLLAAQWVLARLRLNGRFGRVVDNTPLLLMDRTGFLQPNLTAARVTEDDVRAKLREANVLRRSDVLAVVLETTGDVSVLHGDGPLEAWMVSGVRTTP